MSRDDRRLLRKDRLEGFIEKLLQDYSVLGPMRKGGRLFLDRIESAHDLVLGRGNTMNPAKGALFPQTERLFAYRHGEAGAEIGGPSKEDRGLLLFGVRPCDVRGLLLLDKVFGGTPQDPYYADKRDRTVVIGMACETPDPSCFCLSTGGGPCSIDGSDLLFFDLGDRFLAQAGSAKGRDLLQDGAFEDADEEVVAQAEQMGKQAEASMNRAVLGQVGAGEALEQRLEALFDDPLWDSLTESCLGCGICTYLCPTCHCFDIVDEAGPSTGERIRIWDSCQFPLFTAQASGVNPRPSAKERFRQRIMHKFSYLPKNGNRMGCVGCGRCVTECPVNLDIREVVQRICDGEGG